MSQDFSSSANISSSSEEVDPATSIICIMKQLIKQQEKIITLIEKIAPNKEENGNDDDPPPEERLPGVVGDNIENGNDDDPPPEERLPENESDASADSTEDNRLSENERIRRLKLYRAALNGDWGLAKSIYDNYKEDIQDRITWKGDTVLHIAASAKRIGFVKELVKQMNGKDLAQINENQQTALFYAAASGTVEVARELMKDNKAIAMVPDKNKTLPIGMAAALGHKDMVNYLYQETRNSLKEEDCKELFITSIEADLYDIALQLVEKYPNLAYFRSANGYTALHVLARKNLTFSNRTNQNQGGIFKGFLNLGASRDAEKKRLQALQLVICIWKKVVLRSHSEISKLISEPKLIFDAAKRGNIEFLSVLICEYPDLMWKLDDNNYSIFHFAVMNRQENVFKLIYEIGSSKDILFMLQNEKDGNNILHLAGKLAPSDRLNIVSGAAFQMQRELLWFKQVEKVAQRKFAEATNEEGYTPRALFTKEHKELRENGEKWMKETAASCMVVATLIATVVFAAAFTVPGGNKGDTGLPIFLQHTSLKIFAISDAIALASSSLSIVNFLSILNSRYAEEDFLSVLPLKLRFGLVLLFISIATVMIVFCATFFIVFKDGRLWIAIVVTVFAAAPVFLFIIQHFQLFFDVLGLTYASRSLFKQGKSRLFRKEGEASDQRRAAKILNAHLKIQCICSTNV